MSLKPEEIKAWMPSENAMASVLIPAHDLRLLCIRALESPYYTRADSPEVEKAIKECRVCEGTGEVQTSNHGDQPCANCNGTGEVSE